jgi:glycosyltransferase involved in cell wall biosynthesis
VAINLRPPRESWGGAGFFVLQLEKGLRERGLTVGYDLSKGTDLIVLMDPRDDLENRAFGMREIRDYLKAHPETPVLHRINECDARKNTAFMDRLLAEASETASYTVFISEWLRDYHAARWFDRSRPHACIYNGADPRVFHPLGRTFYDGSRPLRLVTHHWSDNPLKGFDVYARIDAMIASGELKDTEFRVIGRWPQTIAWKAARLFPPCHDRKLASLLRQCDVYVTASRWEPCGMHHVEGAQCGLPLLYHEDGGGIVEAGRRYGIGFREDFAVAIQTMKADYPTHLGRLLRHLPSGDRMCLDYVQIIQQLLCARGLR